MRVLLDTHLLLWAAEAPERLPADVRALIVEPRAELVYSTASIWEVAIKFSQGRSDFTIRPQALREGLIGAGYQELQIAPEHVIAVADLPWVHKDPFDRLLIVQAIIEGIELQTVDATLTGYPGPIRLFQ